MARQQTLGTTPHPSLQSSEPREDEELSIRTQGEEVAPAKPQPTLTAEQLDMSRATGASRQATLEDTGPPPASAHKERGAHALPRYEELTDVGAHEAFERIEHRHEEMAHQLYLEEKAASRLSDKGKAAMEEKIELFDERDLGSPAGTRKGTAPPAGADQRLQQAARDLSEALLLKAGELKDGALHFTSSVGKRYSSYLPSLPAALGRAGKTSDWARYGRKMDAANSLIIKAERKASEALSAPPSRSAEPQLEALQLRQKALKKVLGAQKLASRLKIAIDQKVFEIERGLAAQRDVWELYGATLLRTQELLDRSDALFREADSTSDKMKATELHNDAIHLRKKALRKAKKTRHYAEVIKTQSEEKFEQLKQGAPVSPSSSEPPTNVGAGMEY